MGTVRDWWRRLTGRRAEPSAPPAKPQAPPKPPAASGLQLTDAPGDKKPSKVGAAGFDPYASDAGYAKPHSWERVDHD